MQKTFQHSILTTRPVRIQTQEQSGSLLLSGLLLLVSIPAAIITFAILVAMVPVRFLGTLLK